MKAFHNDQAIKDKYLFRVNAHRLADEIHQGEYVNEKDKRYCAVGCTLHSSNHGAYEIELGISRILARLEDGIFEGLPLERAKLWPEEFLTAINIGSDLESVWPKFAVWLLTDKKHGVLQYAKNENTKKSIQYVSDCYARYKDVTKEGWKKAYASVYAAYASVYAAYADSADSVAYAAAAAYAAFAAFAADAVAVYADSAASSAAVAYGAAAYATSATSADAADDADDARKKHRIAQADKLLELLRECV